VGAWHYGLLILSLCGCGRTAPPPPTPPQFTLPAVGDATDTVLRIGDPVPEIRTVDLDGNAVILGQQRFDGGYTLIVFWSTWCGHCMLELPHEVELARRYEPQGLRVIGVNADETPAIALAAVQQYGVPWQNVYEGPDTPISKRLGVEQWPVLLLIGPDGRLISATQRLRGISVDLLPDGSTRTERGLDRTLQHVFETHNAEGG
jgi:thiol-disulfide isomerase/thioredoxin